MGGGANALHPTCIAGVSLPPPPVNTGSDVEPTQFDVQTGDGGVGIFNGCVAPIVTGFPAVYNGTVNWPSDTTYYNDPWGFQYGGVNDASECAALPPLPLVATSLRPAGETLVTLCQAGFTYGVRLNGGGNPTITSAVRVPCPASLVALTNLQRTDESTSETVASGTLTRMLDCCKPSAGWSDNVDFASPTYPALRPCTSDGYTRIFVGCAAGKYAPSTTSTTCSSCAAGKYSAVTGAMSSSACKTCAAGRSSSAGATVCGSCSAGSYSAAGATTCTTCAKGTLSSAGASACTSCAAGSFAASVGSTQCSTCAAGSYSSAGATACLLCAKGTYSAAGSAKCASCAAGSIAASTGAASCSACAAGTYASKTASSACTTCAQGKMSASAGATACTTCAAGSSSSDSHTSCPLCSPVRFRARSAEGVVRCPKCSPTCLPRARLPSSPNRRASTRVAAASRRARAARR